MHFKNYPKPYQLTILSLKKKPKFSNGLESSSGS